RYAILSAPWLVSWAAPFAGRGPGAGKKDLTLKPAHASSLLIHATSVRPRWIPCWEMRLGPGRRWAGNHEPALTNLWQRWCGKSARSPELKPLANSRSLHHRLTAHSDHRVFLETKKWAGMIPGPYKFVSFGAIAGLPG